MTDFYTPSVAPEPPPFGPPPPAYNPAVAEGLAETGAEVAAEVAAEEATLVAAETVAAEEAAVGLAAIGPVGWIILGVVVVGVGGYLIYRATQSSDEKPNCDPGGTQPCPLAQPTTPTPAPVPQPQPQPQPPAQIYKPVIPNQKYSDQTCTDARRDELTQQLTNNKKQIGAKKAPFKPPKRPFDETDPAQAAKKKLLCEDLRNQEQGWQDLIKTRDQMQDECFKSPKTTQDELERDEDHKRAKQEAEAALQNVRDALIKYGCP